MAALVQRAYQLKTITETQRRYLFMNLAKRGYRTREPIETDVPIERPETIMKLAQTHITEFGFSTLELMKMLFYIEELEFRAMFMRNTGLQLVN